MLNNFSLPETVTTEQEKDVSFLFICVFVCMVETARFKVQVEELETAKDELDPFCEWCMRGDDPTQYDEDIEDLEERIEYNNDYIEYTNQYIEETPFGLAANYCDSFEDFFMSHIVSTDTLDPDDILPVLIELLENTPHYEEYETAFHAIEDEIGDKEYTHPNEIKIQLLNDIIKLINENYCPNGFKFGFDGLSDLGFLFTGKASIERRKFSLLLSIPELNYVYEYPELLDTVWALLAINEDEYPTFTVLHYPNLYLGTINYLIVNRETMKIYGSCPNKSTAETYVQRVNNKEIEPICNRWSYSYRTEKKQVTHLIIDGFNGLRTQYRTSMGRTSEQSEIARKETLAKIDQLNAEYIKA